MAENRTITMDTPRFVTGAINLLHAAFIKASRAQAKRHFARINGGAVLDLSRTKFEDGREVLFRVALDHSEFRGRMGFTVFRKALSQLLARLSEHVRMRIDIPVFTNEQNGDILFNVPAVLVEDGQSNVLMLGLDKPEGGTATLRLQFLDPKQFQRSDDAGPQQA